MFIVNKQKKICLMAQNFRDARLDKLDSSTDSWTIFAIKHILLVNKVKMKVINNYNAST